MNLSNKLDGIPTIYYVNYDEHENRNEYIEKNLGNLKVNKFQRVPVKYKSDNVSEWRDLLIDARNYKLGANTAGYAITFIEFIKEWLETTDEKYCIITKDTIDFNIIQFWHFDWKYLMNRIPYDWDCIHMGFENIQCIPFYLHPIMPAHTFGPCLINRFYAKKLVRLHYKEGKYNLNGYIANMNFNCQSGTVDYFMAHNGKTYSLPLFPNNPEFIEKNTTRHKLSTACRLAYLDWWKYDKPKFNLDEFFTYGKPNDLAMIKKTSNYLK